MAMYAKRSCPKCSTTINGWGLNHVKFGAPIIQCPNCKTAIKVDNINEWGLLDYSAQINSTSNAQIIPPLLFSLL